MYSLLSDKQEKIRERTIESAQFIVDNNCTLRYASRNLLVPRSTIHKDIRYRLSQYDWDLYCQVCTILVNNWNHRIERAAKARRWKCAIARTATTHR